MLELKFSNNYPNKYWFQYNKHLPSTAFIQCRQIEFSPGYRDKYWSEFGHPYTLDDETDGFVFTLKSKVSEKRLFSRDFYFCCGPDFISPRLASLLLNNEYIMSDLQLLDASIFVNGTEYHGYKIYNILREVSCIDVEKSDSRLILSDMPDGPRIFTNIVFKKNVPEDFSIARCQEDRHCIVISDKFRDFLVSNRVKGFLPEPE